MVGERMSILRVNETLCLGRGIGMVVLQGQGSPGGESRESSAGARTRAGVQTRRRRARRQIMGNLRVLPTTIPWSHHSHANVLIAWKHAHYVTLPGQPSTRKRTEV